MANPAGEMPFLDHLEELRKRMLLSIVGMTAGIGVGWLVTRHFRLIQVIAEPIAPFVPGGKLMVTTLIAPFMINFKFAVVLGLVLASPWVLYQVWVFLAPALSQREKRAIIPALGIGLLLFLAGALVGWFYVVPPMVKWFIQFDSGSFNTQITYDSYVQLVLHLLLAMGVSAEIPLVMILLALLGVLSYRVYTRFRRYAFFLSFLGGAILAPTPEVSMMILFTIPLLLLFEVGVFGAWIIERRRLRAARHAVTTMILVGLAFAPRRLHAQVPPPPPTQGAPGTPPDTLRRNVTGQGLQSIDAATAKRLGLPPAPTRKFPAPDSVMQALLDREGFAATRYLADSASFNVTDQRILLSGHSATSREGSNLEADRIVYDDARCQIVAEGQPQMFQQGQAPLIGVTMTFNTCDTRGVIGDAFTSISDHGSNWYVRGNFAADSSGKRLYIARSSFTSCDLPDPHYHFVAGQVKWTQGSVMVARPAVLYIRDVPVAWLPFIFQDTKPGNRSSGILIPRFGFNDIVRPVRTYNRAITNLGYYWAPNNYVDVTGHFDWYSNRYVQYGADFNYRWLDRFVQGGLHVNEQVQSDGAKNRTVSWQHMQDFSVTTKLTLNFNYASNTTVLQNNSLNPMLSTQLITSQLALSKRYRWGDISMGGRRSQSLGDGSGTMELPSLTISPKQLSLGRHVTWSPNFSVTNELQFSTPQPALQLLSSTGLDSVLSKSHARVSTINFTTPVQFDAFTWNNAFSYIDQSFVGRRTVVTQVRDSVTDSLINVTAFRGGDFQSSLDWTTGINLPLLLRGTWKVQPSVNVTNAGPGPFLLRSPGSNGAWVTGGKKLQLGLSSTPSLFGFINGGIGPYSRFRYSLSPVLSMHWSPQSTVSAAYARALGGASGTTQLSIPAAMAASLQLHQTFEAKLRPPRGDTTSSDPLAQSRLPKKQIFSISTSSIDYDFEQAKLPGRTGWTTQALSNSFTSDLLQGFTLSTTHDLWQGTAGTDTARFSPFLSHLQANFSVDGRTIRGIAALLGLVHRDTARASTPALGTTAPLAAASSLSMLRSGNTQQPLRRAFSATVSYSLSRLRPTGPTAQQVPTEGNPNDPFGGFTPSFLPPAQVPAQSSLGLTMSFSPTPFWSVSWNTQYDITRGTFESQQIQLQRDLHDWRATFNFVKSPTGNFALTFSVFLLTLPDIKFDYQQTTLQQTPLRP